MTADLPIDVIRSMPELEAVRERIGDRIAFEHLLCERLADREWWTLHGVCQVCSRAVDFGGDWISSWSSPAGRVLSFRERVICPYCKLISRQRFMAQLLLGDARRLPSPAPTFLYEQVTPFFFWAERELPGLVIGSEYLGPDVPGGAIVDGLRHEDALALSFEDASLGAVVSNDVFEHVPDIDRSLAECARVLAPGGRLYFSVPFAGKEDTVQRAVVRDGELVHIEPADYHENPIDAHGSLVFYDHGLDILARCRRAGFADAYALGYWSLLYGYLGEGLQVMFVGER